MPCFAQTHRQQKSVMGRREWQAMAAHPESSLAVPDLCGVEAHDELGEGGLRNECVVAAKRISSELVMCFCVRIKAPKPLPPPVRIVL
jgi:hypothetical protein